MPLRFSRKVDIDDISDMAGTFVCTNESKIVNVKVHPVIRYPGWQFLAEGLIIFSRNQQAHRTVVWRRVAVSYFYSFTVYVRVCRENGIICEPRKRLFTIP